MKILEQTKSTNCGQTCLSMILDEPIETIEDALRNDGVTTEYEICGLLHIPVKDFYEPDSLPLGILFLQLHENPNNSQQKHWTILYNGVTIDPAKARYKESDRWPVKRVWKVR